MIDVIIPCYNVEKTIEKTVKSVLIQKNLNKIWLINDKSTDNTLEIINNLKNLYKDKINVENLYENKGVSIARNYGAILSNSQYIAFLDGDDEYEEDALNLAYQVLQLKPELNVLRLELTPVNIEEKYKNHSNFDYAWQHMRMTCGGNIIFRRSFFLACGGFPNDEIYKKFGGEDGSLGIATTKVTEVTTLFGLPGVLHNCRKGMHAEKLLDKILFGIENNEIKKEDMEKAISITNNICDEINSLKKSFLNEKIGISHLKVEF